MAGYVIWFVVGLALLIAELLTGTFYLLVLSVAAAAAGLAALAGASVVIQLIVASVFGVAGTLLVRRVRSRSGDGAAEALQNLDVGQSLRVDGWNGRRARASYRGALWDVELAPGEAAQPGEFVIREIHANRLVVAARTSAQ